MSQPVASLTIEQRLVNLRKAVCPFCHDGIPFDEEQSRHTTLGAGNCEARLYEQGNFEIARPETFEESVFRIVRENSGSKMAAIKELRALHPMDLIAAKNIIEQHWQ